METDFKSQEAKILAYMETGKEITAGDALLLCGSFRLAARIYRLKNERNVEIVSRYVVRKSKRNGDKHVKAYRLKKFPVQSELFPIS